MKLPYIIVFFISRLCIMCEIIVFFIVMLYAQLYARVGIFEHVENTSLTANRGSLGPENCIKPGK